MTFSRITNLPVYIDFTNILRSSFSLDNEMKLLILVIYSDGEDYREMLKIQRSYLHRFDNVKTYFTMMRENQTEPIVVEDDFVYVKGKETYLGIMYKTVESLEYLIGGSEYYDYVLRTNISTIFNVPLFYDYCKTLPKTNVYTSSFIHDLHWLDPPAGIVDESLWGTKYATGTNIVMSNDVVKYMAANKNKLRYDVVDDLAMGVFMTNELPGVYTVECPPISMFAVPEDFDTSNIDTKYMGYRNRLGSRKDDIRNMQAIVNALYSTAKEGFSTISPPIRILPYGIQYSLFAAVSIGIVGLVYLCSILWKRRKQKSGKSRK